MSDAALDPGALYHLSTVGDWSTSQRNGVIAPESLEAEGFVHCSWGRQVAGTVAKHFAGATDLLALELDPAALGDLALVEEDLYGAGQTFPHVYGPVPVSAVVASIPVSSRDQPA